MRDPSGQLTDSLKALGLSELLARARELRVAYPRDRERLIEAAVKAARFDDQNDRHEARGQQAVKAAGIKADVETPGVENRAQCRGEHPSENDDHQP